MSGGDVVGWRGSQHTGMGYRRLWHQARAGRSQVLPVDQRAADLRRELTRAGRCAAAAGLASLLCAGTALAQTDTDLPIRSKTTPTPLVQSDMPKPAPTPPPPPAPDDGLGRDGFYLEADNLIRDDQAKTWTAQGQVEARYQGRVLRADKVTYDVGTGVVTADGHAQIIETDGTVEAAEHLTLDDKMRAGFARGFSVRTPDDVTFAADVAIRRSETQTELNRAIFTPCPVCAPDGQRITPTWSIAASQVIRDQTRHLVYYRNAVIRIKGVPVFYSPVFWHPDPQSARQSGLLIPLISSNTKLGLSYEQPYLQVISPSQELVVSPQINSAQNPFLNLRWLERFYSGELDARVGYTYSQDFDGQGHRFGDLTSRSFILANGQFDLTQNWSWGFTFNRASDPLIFEKYDIPSVYVDHGLFSSDTQRLLSQLFAVRQDSNSYLSISAIDFQGLRTNSAGVTENSATFPIVAPLIEFRYEPALDILGGRIRFLGDSAVLTTPSSSVDPTDPGVDSRRATAEADWQTNYTLPDGIRISPFLDVRGDFYNVANLTTTDRTANSFGRGLGTAGVDVSWPFIRQDGDQTIILEPVAQVALSPNVNLNPNIPNLDSQVVTFDETNLFSMDRFSGFDLYEGGQRINLGGRATVDWGDGLDARVLFGRSFRADTQEGYPPNTGLDKTASDWVVAGDSTPVDGVSMFGRMLLDNSFDPELAEFGVDYARDRGRAYFRYDYDNTQPTGRTSGLEGGGEYFITRHWGVGLAGIRDLELNDWRQRDLSLIYMDDCVRVDIVYQHDDTVVGRLGHSDSVFVRLKLATLGDEGYRNADFR